jgi:predicted secreted hydrolase
VLLRNGLVILLACVGSTLICAQAPAGGGSAAGWKHAAPGRPITLPLDHANHGDYKLEWWYYTGNLDAADGRRFGYQLTFFRVGVDPNPPNPSRWAVRDLFMAHLALTDVSGRRFLFTERLNRAGPGWAGAASDRYRVWNEDWEATLDSRAHRLRAAGAGRSGVPFAIDLTLTESGPPVLNGIGGYSQKGSDAGNASHYYSLPRMETGGSITLDGRPIPVNGFSWMDHEFGTSFLEAGQLGWDWFAIQLQNGRSLMLYRFRRADGSVDAFSSGTMTSADGRFAPAAFSEVELEPGRTWTSPASGGRYPVEWSLKLPREKLTLHTTAVLDGQELQTSGSAGVTYWEGAIDVTGDENGKPVTGRGYLEMTGYVGATMSNYLR